MKYKQLVYTPFVIFIAILKLLAANESRGFAHDLHDTEFKIEKISSLLNKSSSATENSLYQKEKGTESYERGNVVDEEMHESEVFTQNFPEELNKCIEDHKYQISENYMQGKNIIFNCFKATLILNLVKYLGASPRSGFKFFNGLLELKKIPNRTCIEEDGGEKKCKEKRGRRLNQFRGGTLSQEKKNEYVKMYKKAMEKLVSEKIKFKTYRNVTAEEKANQLNKINAGSQAFLSEIIRNLGNEKAEQAEEEKLKREITDPRLVSVLDAFSKNYMLKLKFFPGASARIMRSHNGGVTFDLEIDSSEETEVGSDEASTREINDSKPQVKDYDDSGEGNKKKRKKGKKKKKEIKKKAKKLKKIIPYLLLPMLIQMTLLPFVFKKLFFLAMKALFAGKVALILVGFNLLRNTCINQESGYDKKIRVEHYGYNKGEEYGAWVNGRSFQESSVMEALSEAPFLTRKPVSS